MEYFYKTIDSIPDGVGFSHFDSLHIAWLVGLLVVLVVNCWLYGKLGASGRKIWKRCIACLLIADELFKMVVLIATKQYAADYLPLHLCSINIFIIVLHVCKPSKLLDNFLYTVCIPGTMAALLFPSWTRLPLMNAMHIHSFTVHFMLALYPIVLVVNGELKPSLRMLPKSLGLLLLMTLPIYGMNLLLDTNFMFLMYVDPGNPLHWFGENWGSHLLGFPVIIFGVLVVMYSIPEAYYRIRKRR